MRPEMGRLVTGTLLRLVILLAPLALVWPSGDRGLAPTIHVVLVTFLALAEARTQEQRRAAGFESGLVLPSPPTLGLGVVLVVALLDHQLRAQPPVLERLVGGAALFALGGGIRWTAMATLGRWYLEQPQVLQEQPLVTDGIYGQMRHPGDAAAVLIAIGAALLLGSGLALLLCIFGLVPLVLWSTRREDRRLAERFGEAFEEHRRTVPALVPRPRDL